MIRIDAVAAAMYTIGFAETVRDLLKVRRKKRSMIVLMDRNLGTRC